MDEMQGLVQLENETEILVGSDTVEAPEKELVPKPLLEDMPAIIFSLIFANGKPLSIQRIQEITQHTEEYIRSTLEGIRSSLLESDLGIDLLEIGGAYQIRSKVALAPYIRQLKATRPKKLSNQALETLAVVAYRQPIVKSDIETIRGVDATPTLKTLLDRKLIKIVGHQPTVGQPALYGTTEGFLELFGLASLSELPTLRDLEVLQKDPGEEGESETSSFISG